MNIETLWLRTLQMVCGRAAHEIKGAMNGVAVNLEVVRSRVERGNAVAGDVQRYAGSATDQLGALIAMTEGLLGLTRAGREPADVVQVGRQLASVLGPAARSSGRTLEFCDDSDGGQTTGAPLSAVRLILAAALLDATDGAELVICRVRSAPDLSVSIAPVPAEAQCMREALDAIAVTGIVSKMDGHGISITFPPVDSHDRNPIEVV